MRWRSFLRAVVILGIGTCCGACEAPSKPRASEPLLVFTDHLRSGFDLGVESSLGRRHWVQIADGALVMRYPRDEFWGVVFLVAGVVASPPYASVDVSLLRSLRLEMRGTRARSSVRIAVADRDDPEGHDAEGEWIPLGTEWRPYTIDLDRFSAVDLERLYVVTAIRFVGGSGDTVYCRNVRFEP